MLLEFWKGKNNLEIGKYEEDKKLLGENGYMEFLWF